ncbi:hypothetical protein [Pseudomonas sp. microsymbiont 2]
MAYKEINSFAFFNASAVRYLKVAARKEEGFAFDLMSAMVMSAFSVEAYFNHLGAKKIPHWFDKYEKKSVWDKYKILRSAVGLSVLTIPQAYPDVAAVLEFRNNMAHGRTERHELEIFSDPESDVHCDQPVGWQTSLDASIVDKRLKSCQSLIKELHNAAGLGRHPFFALSSSTSFTPIASL